VSGAPVLDLHFDGHAPVRRATRPNHKHIPCSPARLKAGAVRALAIGLVTWHFGAAIALAQPLGPNEVPRPEERPVFVQPSPIGDLEYRPGRGLRVGDTGLTVGGFAAILADRKEEGGTTHFTLDDLNLFLLFDPTPYFHVFSELGFENLVELGDTETHPEPRDGLLVDRLYGDLNLSDRVNVRFGKFFTPVGIWNEIPAEPLLWTNSRPLVTEGPFDEQVTGAMTWGSFFPADGTLTYKFYGQFLQPLDPDPRIQPVHRSAGARLEYRSLAAWGIGSSYFASERGGRWNHVGGADALWRAEKGEIMGEFLVGRGDPAGRHLAGFYLQGVRELVHTLSIVGRYEYFDPGSPLRVVNLFDFGFSWRPSPYIVFTLDYLLADRTAGIDRTEQNLPGLRFQLSVLF
jgi:hypothetical protein